MLSVWRLTAVICPFLFFLVLSLTPCLDASTQSLMMGNPLPPFFLDTYSLSVLSLGCNAFCIIINFLVLRSICLTSSLVHFKNGPEYLTRGTAQVLLLPSLVSRGFLVLLRFSYLFFHLCLFEGIRLQYSQVRGSLNKFPDVFRMGTFIDSTHMKL